MLTDILNTLKKLLGGADDWAADLVFAIETMSLQDFVQWALLAFIVLAILTISFNMMLGFVSSSLRILRRLFLVLSGALILALILLWLGSDYRACFLPFDRSWRDCDKIAQNIKELEKKRAAEEAGANGNASPPMATPPPDDSSN